MKIYRFENIIAKASRLESLIRNLIDNFEHEDSNIKELSTAYIICVRAPH
jgi:hypothetical protein